MSDRVKLTLADRVLHLRETGDWALAQVETLVNADVGRVERILLRAHGAENLTVYSKTVPEGTATLPYDVVWLAEYCVRQFKPAQLLTSQGNTPESALHKLAHNLGALSVAVTAGRNVLGKVAECFKARAMLRKQIAVAAKADPLCRKGTGKARKSKQARVTGIPATVTVGDSGPMEVILDEWPKPPHGMICRQYGTCVHAKGCSHGRQVHNHNPSCDSCCGGDPEWVCVPANAKELPAAPPKPPVKVWQCTEADRCSLEFCRHREPHYVEKDELCNIPCDVIPGAHCALVLKKEKTS